MVRLALHILFGIIITVVALGIIYRFIPVPLTPLMVIRLFQGEGFSKDWVPLEQISPNLQRAVIAAEDGNFCLHNGFDWKALEKVYTDWQRGGRMRGGSTISQQTAKNIWLWPNSDIIRKGLEVPLTYFLERTYPKRRILEVYLNIIEWAPGVYGAEAAARKHFGTSAKNLTTRQAALMAAVLPNPRKWSASKPGPYVRQRAGLIQARAARVGRPPCLKAE